MSSNSYVTTVASALQVLEIHGSGLTLTELFAGSSFPVLESASISVFDDTTRSDLPKCTALFARAVQYSALRKLLLHFNRVFSFSASAHDADSPAAVSLASLLRPLLSASNMEEFILRFDASKLCSNDEIFVDIAQAWTHLRILRLDFRTWHADGPIPTPLVLVHLAHHGPRLQEIVLPYLAHDASMDQLPYDGAIRPHPLRRLFVADDRERGTLTSTGGTERLAHVLAELFPHLDTSFRSFIRDSRLAWSRIFDVLRARDRADELVRGVRSGERGRLLPRQDAAV